MEPTSEQELKQLLDEGRITEDEYRELLEAIRQKETVQKPVDVSQQPTEPKPRTGYGKAALIMFVLSIALPILGILLSLVLNMIGVKMLLAAPFVLIGLLCGLLAFIFGIIGWKTTQGKIAAIGVPLLGLLIVPGFMVLSLFHVRVENQHRREKHLVSYKHYLIDSIDGILTQDGVEFDEQISSDGNGSLKCSSDSDKKRVVHLFETGPFPEAKRILIYSAKVKSELKNGKAYLEMWYVLPSGGEYFSRGIDQPIAGETNWITLQTPFQVKYATPFNVKLNLVIEGVGTVWIDDVKLSSSQY